MTGTPLASGTDGDAIHDNVPSEISAITEKSTPTSSDYLIIEDVADSNAKKRITIGNLPSSAADHGALTGLSDDDHTQYSLANGTRAFSGTVSGVTPTASAHLATKGYVDAAIPSGVMLPYGGATAPSGYLLCDGSAVSRTTYGNLFSAIGTAYGSGDGSTTFNIPDMQGAFPIGKAASGTASSLGDTGGELDSSINIAHSHTVNSHTHTINHGHADTIATASNGAHTHTMPTHTHTGPSHTHSINHDHGAVTSGGATVGSAHSSQGTSGLYSQDDLDSVSDNTSHRHGDGSLEYQGGPVNGYTSYATASHYHLPAQNAKAHTHSVNLPSISATSGSGGTGNTGATDPGDTNSSGSHTHSVTGGVTDHSGSSGSSSPGTNSQLSSSQSIANPPFVTMNYIIKV